jgi:hypothetical protein
MAGACVASANPAATWRWVPRASRRQALATPEAKANTQNSSATNAMLRFERMLEKSFMLVQIYAFNVISPTR